jgi:tetratricopeptide (TPR) repeat protein
MGMLYDILGRKDEALATIEQALSLHEAKFGKDDLEVAQMLNALANVQIDRQHYDEAVQALERAQTVQERELGPEHPLLGATIATLGRAYRTRGDFARALPALERALRIEEVSTGPEDPSVGRAHYNLGELYYAWGKDALAIASLERSLSVTSVPAEELGDTRMVLARALWRSGEDRERAARLVSEAQVDYRRASSGRGEPGLADAQAWLAEHPPP